MQTGDVKWFNNAKGYGFIQTEEHDEDVFVHYSQINDDGFKTLKAGETVEFELCKGPKGLYAEEICREADIGTSDDSNEAEQGDRIIARADEVAQPSEEAPREQGRPS